MNPGITIYFCPFIAFKSLCLSFQVQRKDEILQTKKKLFDSKCQLLISASSLDYKRNRIVMMTVKVIPQFRASPKNFQ